MSDWIKCSENLPSDEEICWISTDEGVCEGWFEEKCNRYQWDERTKSYVNTIEDGFRLDSDYCRYAYLDVVKHWMPYYTPEPPNE